MLPRRGGAKALMLTVLGEFVLPAGGQAWTSSLVAAAGTLGVSEKSARQAIARIGSQGLLESRRHGRLVRWELTDNGRELLETGTTRIYEFAATEVEWDGGWLFAHCPVAESRRSLRIRLRNQLGFLGFGEMSASLLVSPHVDRESRLREVLDQLGLLGDSIVMRSTLGSSGDDAEVVRRAWDLGRLTESYQCFTRAHQRSSPETDADKFRALVELVHDWRAFPSVDPELPTQLLPAQWAGGVAASVFRDRHQGLTSDARRWFENVEARQPSAV